MIIAKDLITLLQRVPGDSEITIYVGQRQGLYCSNSKGWIEIGDETKRILVDSQDHCFNEDHVQMMQFSEFAIPYQ